MSASIKATAKCIRALKSLPMSKASLFVTSRPHPHDVEQLFEEAVKKDIKASETDIKQYCYRMIEESPNASGIMSDSLKQQVTDTIASRADGM